MENQNLLIVETNGLKQTGNKMFKNIHNWPLEHWHIELCSKCSLKCPRCSRQEVPEGLSNKELSLEWFKKNFTGKLLKNVPESTSISAIFVFLKFHNYWKRHIFRKIAKKR